MTEERPGPESGEDRPKLPIHVAVYYLGSATPTGDGVGVPGRAGPFIQCLSEAVDHVTVVAFAPPADPQFFEDGVEYEVQARNVDLLSLGPKGTWRDYLRRRQRVARTIGRASSEWDVLIFYQLPNRRAHLVYRSNRCPRSVALVVGTVARSDLSGASAFSRLVAVLTQIWRAFQQREVIRRSRVVVVNNEELIGSIEGRAPEEIQTVMLSQRRAHEYFRTPDRFNGTEVNLLFAGRITLEKGPLVAVDAFARVKQDLPDARLHVVGSGPALEAMLERASELGLREDLVVHGWLPPGGALYQLYQEMDVLLFASYADYEGFPAVLWDVMAQSVLAISTRVRGPDRAFEHERDVLFVPMKDPVAMADAVQRLVNDPSLRRRLLRSAFEKARLVSMDDTVRGILDGVTAAWPELAPTIASPPER